jgi:hypothetical protein
MAGITGTGYQQAFEQAQNQFNEEARRQMEAQQLTNRYGFDVAKAQQDAGAGTTCYHNKVLPQTSHSSSKSETIRLKTYSLCSLCYRAYRLKLKAILITSLVDFKVCKGVQVIF